MKTLYHVFSNERDEWFDSYDEAKQLFNEWKEECGTARIYEETHDENDELVEENCIDSFGEWPL